jgi:tripartite-type tricarboxylate transporter receptor subunit TctC
MKQLLHLKRIDILAIATVAAMTMAIAAAADFPARPVRVVVPSTPGGALDILSRMLAQKLPERWNGHPLVVDNRAGAGGIIGSEIVARSEPDGYTLLVVALGYAANPFLYKLPYRTPQDFSPITVLASAPNVLVIHPSVPANSVKELIALAKAKPKTLVYASSGVGTSGHLAMELFKRMAGVDMIHVPFKGAGASNSAIVAGQVQILNTALGAAMTFIRSGKLKGLAVTGLKRATSAPEIPTVIESGLPGYVVDGWFAALTPAKTPQAIVDKLQADFASVYAQPDMAARLAAQGFEADNPKPQATAKFIDAEIAKWGKVIREGGIKGD